MAVNHLLNAWNFQLTWFVHKEVSSQLGLFIPFGIGEEENLSLLLHHKELVLV